MERMRQTAAAHQLAIRPDQLQTQCQTHPGPTHTRCAHSRRRKAAERPKADR
jgi:hypothetical protein